MEDNFENPQSTETTHEQDASQANESTQASGVYYQNPPVNNNTQGQYQSYDTYNSFVQPKTNTSNGFQIASLVLGIVSIVGCCCGVLVLPCAVVGLILGIIGMKKAKECGANSGMALAGIITSSVGIVIGLICVVFMGLTYLVDDSFAEFYREFGNGYYNEFYDYTGYHG